MLDQGMIYFYGSNSEHNGPYKDLAQNTIKVVKANGVDLKFSHIARGIYKIETAQKLKSVDLQLLNYKTKLKSNLKLNIE